MKTEKALHEPLFHTVKRDEISWKKAWLIRGLAIVAALVVSAIVLMILTGENPIGIYSSMISGIVGTEGRIWNTLQSAAILLCISLAVTPAFKMKFWNIGAEGQVLAGGLACAACMFYLGDSLPTPVLIAIMTVSSVAAGAVWALFPSIFKAKWNTNETLFTLMMNYIAIQLVSFCLKVWVTSGSGVLTPMPKLGLPIIGDMKYLLNIIIVAVLTVVMYIYLKYSKHGYEISVVGESENTARYIGINVKKVVIRTAVVSGAVCGLAGLLLVGGTNYTISTTTAGGRGFTAIMVSWLAKFHPLYMIFTTFLIVFLERGSKQMSTDFRLDPSIADILTGIILFFIIGCEFFIQYKVVFRKNHKEVHE